MAEITPSFELFEPIEVEFTYPWIGMVPFPIDLNLDPLTIAFGFELTCPGYEFCSLEDDEPCGFKKHLSITTPDLSQLLPFPFPPKIPWIVEKKLKFTITGPAIALLCPLYPKKPETEEENEKNVNATKACPAKGLRSGASSPTQTVFPNNPPPPYKYP